MNEIPFRALLIRDADGLPVAVRELATTDPNMAEAIAIGWAIREMRDVEQPHLTSLVLERGDERRVMAHWGDAERSV